MADNANFGGTPDYVRLDDADQRRQSINSLNAIEQTNKHQQDPSNPAQSQASTIAPDVSKNVDPHTSGSDTDPSTSTTGTSRLGDTTAASSNGTVHDQTETIASEMASEGTLPALEANAGHSGQKEDHVSVPAPTEPSQKSFEDAETRLDSTSLNEGPNVPHSDEVSLVPLPEDLPKISESAATVADEPRPNQPEAEAETAPVVEPTGSSEDTIDYDHDEQSDGVLRLKPTSAQWEDFPGILSTARKLGATKDGCFKVVLPNGLLGPVPEKLAQRLPAKAYRPHQIKRTRIWQVGTVETEGDFPSSTEGIRPNFDGSTTEAFKKLSHLFNKNKGRQMRDVRYRVDVPAWNGDQRINAGVPEVSPMHPLKGDKLDQTKAIIPGIHTPYVYESGPAFGATFQIHAEDYRLLSLNHLYKGRKIWVVIPSGAVDLLEEKLERRGKCSQFMRHRAEFLFPEKLKRLEIPHRIIDQRPGETIVILPDAYHEGFSTGYTLAEAKNYAEPDWTAASYQACDQSCKFLNMIPTDHMELVQDGEQRIDLCALLDAENNAKRKRESSAEEEEREEREAQKPRMSVEGISVA